LAPTSPDFGNLKKLDDIQLELKISGNDLAEIGSFVGKKLVPLRSVAS